MDALILWFAMMVMHYLADWVLQTDVVAKYKQKINWEEYINKNKMYKDDYRAVLEIHCIFWTICINIPLLIYEFLKTGFDYASDTRRLTALIFFIASFILNMGTHYVVDELKANKLVINLRTDQTIHYFQIIITLAVYMIIL